MDDDNDGRAEPASGGGPAEASGAPEARSTPGDQVRISAVEAAVAAGLAPSTGRKSAPEHADEPVLDERAVSSIELPDWQDPPTGQVPRILLGELTEEGEDPFTSDPVVRGPIWREESADWDDQIDLSFLVEEDDLPGGDALGDASARGFGLPGAPGERPAPESADALEDDWAPLLDRSAPAAEHGAARGARPRRRHADASGKRSPLVATLTGLAAAAVAAACFLAGSVATVALVALVATLAAGEAFSALRRGGYAPATLLGLIAVPALVLGAYIRGLEALPAVLGVLVVASGVWFLLRRDAPPVANLALSVLVVVWIGVLASFAGLLLAPADYPHRHGVAFVVAAVALTVAHDVGSYAVGARLGRHKLATRVSPNKTVEGLLGGTVLTLVVAALVVSHLHPLHIGAALVLGVVVACFAPLGDLTESLVKRDLGIKDMGRILPAHGGVLDRIDAMLFVLPATFYALHALGIG